MQALAAAPEEREVPPSQRKPRRQPLAWYLQRHARDDAIVRVHREGGHTQTAIAMATGLSVSRISRLVAAGEAKGKTPAPV